MYPMTSFICLHTLFELDNGTIRPTSNIVVALKD
jgi:hypothetical protein